MFVLFLVHLLSAIFWMGSTLFVGLVLEPAVAGLGRRGGELMFKLIPGINRAMTAAGVVTILAGLGLYVLHTGGFEPRLMFQTRLPLTLGALSGFAALLIGVFLQGPTSAKLLSLYEQIAERGGQPTPEQARSASTLQKRLRLGGRLESIFMLLAVIGMAA